MATSGGTAPPALLVPRPDASQVVQGGVKAAFLVGFQGNDGAASPAGQKPARAGPPTAPRSVAPATTTSGRRGSGSCRRSGRTRRVHAARTAVHHSTMSDSACRISEKRNERERRKGQTRPGGGPPRNGRQDAEPFREHSRPYALRA